VIKKRQVDDRLERAVGAQKKAIFASADRALGATIPPEAQADYAELQKKIAAEVSARLDAKAVKGDFTRIYRENFSKEELDGISTFYDTPLGQVILTKQTQVEQKIQLAMAPRVAELSAQLQQMGREFAKEQKAKFMGSLAAPTPASAGPAPAPKP